jgi:hypothetical protein
VAEVVVLIGMIPLNIKLQVILVVEVWEYSRKNRVKAVLIIQLVFMVMLILEAEEEVQVKMPTILLMKVQ